MYDHIKQTLSVLHLDLKLRKDVSYEVGINDWLAEQDPIKLNLPLFFFFFQKKSPPWMQLPDDVER